MSSICFEPEGSSSGSRPEKEHLGLKNAEGIKN
jgi:hypothetical protein